MKFFKLMSAIWFIVSLLLCRQLPAQTKNAPAAVAAALLVKVLGFEKNISAGEITIYVLASPAIAAALKTVMGETNIKHVHSGNNLPASKPSVLFIGDESKLSAAIEYTRKNKVLSATSVTDLVIKGVSVGFGIGDNNKPKILLNINSSAEEDLEWNPAIMKVAQIIK